MGIAHSVSIDESAEVGGVVSGGQIIQFCLFGFEYAVGAKMGGFYAAGSSPF